MIIDYYKKIKNSNFKLSVAFNRRYFHIWVIVAIVFLASWLRLNHFSDWLHYEFDQSRDNILVSEALKRGPAYLPMMGPKADGTQLRVGPIYYYFEYLSALVFGDTPAGHAYFVVLLSLASIPIFYLLLKKFFRKTISLGLIYLYSISFFMVLYSRFGWNPNVLPFFVISGIYCLLCATEERSKYPGRWFVACVFFFTVATQLHFVAFFVLPFFTIVYLLYARPKFSWKTWLVSLLIFAGIYAPVVVSDIVLDGFNSREFIHAFSVKTDQEDTAVKKTIKTFRSGAENYALILSGNDRIWTPNFKFEDGGLDISCKNYCKKTDPWLSYSVLGFFLFSALLIIWQTIKRRKPIIIMGLFFVAVFFVFTKISIEPRFYLLAAPLPFFFLGNILELVWRKNALFAKIIFIGLLILLSYTNLSRMIQRFSDLEGADKKLILAHSDRILEEPERVSLRQFQSVSKKMASRYEENGYPVIFASELLYSRSFMYLVEKMGAPVGIMEKGRVYQNANNFAIFRTRKAGGIKSYLENYEVSNKLDFGTLTLFELTPKADRVTEMDTPRLPDSFDYISVPQQTIWGDVFGR